MGTTVLEQLKVYLQPPESGGIPPAQIEQMAEQAYRFACVQLASDAKTAIESLYFLSQCMQEVFPSSVRWKAHGACDVVGRGQVSLPTYATANTPLEKQPAFLSPAGSESSVPMATGATTTKPEAVANASVPKGPRRPPAEEDY
jgi:hypothetical protein